MFDRRHGACGGVVQQYAANKLITRFEKQPEIGESVFSGKSRCLLVCIILDIFGVGLYRDATTRFRTKKEFWHGKNLLRDKAVNHNETCLSTYFVAFQPTSVLNSALPLHSLVNSPLSSVSSALPFPTADSFVNESRAPWSRELHEE